MRQRQYNCARFFESTSSTQMFADSSRTDGWRVLGPSGARGHRARIKTCTRAETTDESVRRSGQSDRCGTRSPMTQLAGTTAAGRRSTDLRATHRTAPLRLLVQLSGARVGAGVSNRAREHPARDGQTAIQRQHRNTAVFHVALE